MVCVSRVRSEIPKLFRFLRLPYRLFISGSVLNIRTKTVPYSDLIKCNFTKGYFSISARKPRRSSRCFVVLLDAIAHTLETLGTQAIADPTLLIVVYDPNKEKKFPPFNNFLTIVKCLV